MVFKSQDCHVLFERCIIRLINMQSVQVFFVAVCLILNYLRTMKPHKLVCLLFVSLNSEKSLKNHQHFVFEKHFVLLRRLMKLFTACIEFTKSTKHYRLCVDNDSLDRIQKRVFSCLI